jgi:hypothetical protein
MTPVRVGLGPTNNLHLLRSATPEYLLDPTEKVQVADATDEAFYRKYRRMDPTTKHRIRRMVDLWGDDRADDK